MLRHLLQPAEHGYLSASDESMMNPFLFPPQQTTYKWLVLTTFLIRQWIDKFNNQSK